MNTKKILALVAVVMFALTLLVVPASAAAATFTLSAADAKTSSTMVVKVNATIPTAGFNVIISYDKDVLTYASNTTQDANFTVTDNATEGQITLGYTNLTGADLSGEVATITFNTIATSSFVGTSKELTFGIVNALTRRGAIDVYDKGGVNYTEADLSFTGATANLRTPHTAPVVTAEIEGTPTSGQTLTAKASTEDNWDLTPTYTYQWKADGADIAGATASTYALTAADYDKEITVVVTATVEADDNPVVTATSAKTAKVVVPSDAPTLTVVESRDDTVAVGAALDTNATAAAAALVGGEARLAYVWKLNGTPIADATAKTYVPTEADYGTGTSHITCDVTATSTRNSATATKTVTFSNAIVAGNMKPVISDLKVLKGTDEVTTAVVGDTLKASYEFADIADASTTGLGDTDASTFQWFRGEDAIEGATEAEYAVTPADIAKNITVKVVAKSTDATPNTNIANYGDVTLGNELTSAAVAAALNPEYLPTVTNVAISSKSIKVNSKVTVSYDYEDKNGFADASTIKFEVADTEDAEAWTEITSLTTGAEITVAGSTATIKLDKTFADKFIKITVAPKNSNDMVNDDVTAATVYEVKKVVSSSSGALNGPSLVGGTTAPTTEPTTEPTTTPGTGTEGGTSKFTDLEDYAWAEQAINALVEEEVIFGISDTEFAPAKNVTRAQFTAMMARALGLVKEDAKTAYTDIAADYWGYKEIASCEALGIFDYIEGAEFAPEEELRRDEMALIAFNTAKAAGITMPKIGEAITFDDAASINAVAADAVAALSQAGIILGNGDGTFAPAATTVRAAAAKVVYMVNVLK